VTVCRSCQREILWCVTPAGRSIPIDINDPLELPEDPERWPRGLFVLDRDGASSRAIPATEVQFRGHAGPFYRTHFATCPFADRHRRKRRA
jgi:hypothetical protein